MNKKLKLIVGSTRQGRNSIKVANWLAKQANEAGYDLELLDLKQVNLPMFDSAVSPMYAAIDTPEAKAWGVKISEADGIVFLTAEYNRSIPASLKNAIDYLYTEWNGKKAAIISYGWIDGGGSATKHLRDIIGFVKMDIVGSDIAIPFTQETFDETYEFKDIDAALGGIKEGFIATLEALSA